MAIPILILAPPNAWRASLFACTNLYPNGLMAWYCPCVALAQIAARVGVCGGYHRVLCGVGSLLVAGLLSYMMSEAGLLSYMMSEAVRDDDPIRSHHLKALSFLSFLSVAIVLGAIRTRVRGLYDLVGSELEDHGSAICCFWCTLVQLGAEVESFTPDVCRFGARETLPSYCV
ncbi:hypothetical protein SPRG_07106 [Saprolegnia parasitica CBS 223.65]|uniref:Uncharacterized protein n=1 Tax=Saprolegnia parasitica (strain CBS 223.65) TaxID=695850 RepID=A0A067CBG9_SAPPC|nr:hypothetical protein SPRG_07106 [Saprolegnia parasitica CBS 223.65]KDO27833.1 hypothetical protein SPRG_07106 [Saprolegnia parasitica CBS 223.65]|eukprot:XP_012201293.1 hypothetical protein SPRG_07106 [Saprolegnia parasitica CBS 223.65]